VVARALTRRNALTRDWARFFERYPVLLVPVSGELPFPDGLDLRGEAELLRVWHAQLTQRAVPALSLPGLTVTTGLAGKAPVGVQLVAARYREDLLLRAGEIIEAAGVPPMPVDPA
jgi:amidase